MPHLELWGEYERREVHDIFSPDTAFTPQAGSWGLWGIVRVPETVADYVFFVTFGATTGAHEFAEQITHDGVLTWQSQPRQTLDSPAIRQFIDHDDLTSTIHLFLRTRRSGPYTYFGALGYLDHDSSREAPVHFTWQLLDWPAPAEILARAGVTTATSEDPDWPSTSSGGLLQAEPPARREPRRTDKPGLSKQAFHQDQDARNAKLGLTGEKLVLAHEGDRLRKAGRHDLADKIVHVSVVEGDGAGYDVRSFEVDGSARHIEVKTTRGPRSSAFFISPNEVRFSQDHPETYVLIRVFGFRDDPAQASYYEVRGPIRNLFDLTPSEYRAQVPIASR